MQTKQLWLSTILGFGLILGWLPPLTFASPNTTALRAPGDLTGPNTATVSVTLNASQDNTLYENPTGALSNGAGQYFFVGRTAQGTNSIRRGLIKFDVAGSIPAGSTILSVTLRLNMLLQTMAGPQPVELHRVTADWGQGTSAAAGAEGGGAAATPGDATWIHRFHPSTLWTAPGGDFVAAASAATTVGGIGTYVWSTPGMVADVQTWLDTASTNNGWLLLGGESTSTTAKRFNASENSSASTRPALLITYETPNAIYLPFVFK